MREGRRNSLHPARRTTLRFKLRFAAQERVAGAEEETGREKGAAVASVQVSAFHVDRGSPVYSVMLPMRLWASVGHLSNRVPRRHISVAHFLTGNSRLFTNELSYLPASASISLRLVMVRKIILVLMCAASSSNCREWASKSRTRSDRTSATLQ